MIFATVGTHEQPMTRLYQALEAWAAAQSIAEPVIVQSGETDFAFKHCHAQAFLSFQELERRMREARVVITHGGPATILQACAAGKVPVVVPRLHAFQEHVNDHQLEFARRLEARGQILLVTAIEALPAILRDYERLAREKSSTPKIASTRGELCQRLTDYCESLYKSPT